MRSERYSTNLFTADRLLSVPSAVPTPSRQEPESGWIIDSSEVDSLYGVDTFEWSYYSLNNNDFLAGLPVELTSSTVRKTANGFPFNRKTGAAFINAFGRFVAFCAMFVFTVNVTSFNANAQAPLPEDVPVYKISQGEILHNFPADAHSLDQTTWVLTSPDGKTLNSKGTSLLSYKFEQVGRYTIALTRMPLPKHDHKEGDGHRCDHYYMPPSISVQVAAEKIEYLCETMKTSKPIVGGQSTEGIKLSITVTVTGSNVRIPETIVSAGVETTIVGKLDASQESLQAGTHTLVYHLSGQGKKGTYIQFDFEDTNSHMTPCGYMQQL